MILALVIIPAVAGVLCFAVRLDRLRRALLVMGAAAHTTLTVVIWVQRPRLGAVDAAAGEWLVLDEPGRLFLSITSVLFLAAAIYGIGYLARESRAPKKDLEEGMLFSNAPEAVLTGCLLFFLATMTLVCTSHHMGLLWVAIEATTLASAPLIFFHRQHRSLEAAYKYLIICSVGIALALLGTFFLAASAMKPDGTGTSLVLGKILENAGAFRPMWLKAAFIFLLVGYGTKMGLAPMHTWLPDAHSESPSLVSALLSGALLNCAFLGILRAQQILAAAGQAAFGQELLIVFGLVSMGVAAIFILAQADFKRMLAYSSVEHMGILVLGIGLGGVGAFGSMFHAVNHSLTKAMLFFVAGNIMTAYSTKLTAGVKGAIRFIPFSGVLWVMGFLSITGSPPFGTFLSELTILKAALEKSWVIAGVYLLLLAVIFIGMATAVLRMAQGVREGGVSGPRKKSWLAILPPAVLCLIVLVLGLYLPSVLSDAFNAAANAVGGGR